MKSALHTITATLALAACVTAPAASPLTGGEWRVVQVGGAGVVANSRAALAFGPDGRLSGNASCNRLTGSYTRDGARLTIGQTALTRMACPPAEMRQEARVVEVLEDVTHYEIDPTGALMLRTPAGVGLVARR
ncbi:META domain-containing protein [Tsuneonella sp. HG249]